jgi:hypothetical protein
MSTREASQVLKLPADAIEARVRRAGRPGARTTPSRFRPPHEGDARPWTALQTQTLIYAREALGMSDAETARFVKRSPQAVARRSQELVAEGRPRADGVVGLRRRLGGSTPGDSRTYEENVPAGTIEFMLGITPMQLATQVRRLLHEGLSRR